jgi:hypothetical protein
MIMSAAAQVDPLPRYTTAASNTWIWVGRSISTVVILFCIFDAVTKLIKEPHVVAATLQVGYAEKSIVLIGALLLACTILYAIPRTAILGAILLTAYLGGAVATNVRISSGAFNTLFPVVFAVLAWGAIFVREPRLRELIPLRK